MLGIAPSKFAGKQGGGNGDDDDDSRDGKESKAAVEYGPAQACRWCRMFLPKTEECTAVEGRISPAGWCRLYEPDERGEGDDSGEGDERYCGGGRARRRRQQHDQGW